MNKQNAADSKKITIAILFGGNSPEYGVSLKSAYSVITHIDEAKYEPILLGINQKGEWFYFFGEPDKILSDTWNNPANCMRAIISPSRETQGIVIFEKYGNVRSMKIDVAMPVLHGKNGEDGTVQGLLELAGIPIVGCNTLASALCMDKDRAHKIVEQAGVKIARSFTITDEKDAKNCLEKAQELGLPLFIKPVKAGSSYGITRLSNENNVLISEDFLEAVELALNYDDEVIIEENIDGFEVGCAVLGDGADLIVGEVDEIELTDGFFNYKEKYTLETSKVHVPARIKKEKAKEVKETAKTIYKALGCSGFARVDMFLTPAGDIVFNEVNTIPGFTSHSRYPNMLKAIGMTFDQVIDTLIESAIKT